MSRLHTKPTPPLIKWRAWRQSPSGKAYRERKEARRKIERLALKIEAIRAYGGRCVGCGERPLPFLTIDHINGGGNAHRKQIAPSGKGGAGPILYRLLKRQGWPTGYRVLCWNCNCRKIPKLGPVSRMTLKRRLDRQQVIEGYGGFCQCCHEDDPTVLHVDHVSGDGARKNREQFNRGRHYSTYLHRWLIANNFPNDYQLLCANCNCGRHINGGICPHKTILC